MTSRALRPSRRTTLPLVLFILLTTMWGSSYFFTALALESFAPLLIVFLRVAVGAVMLGVLVVALRLPLPRWGKIYFHFLMLGVLSIAIPFTLITAGQVHVNSSMAAILISTTPLFVFLIVSLHTRNERFTMLRLGGIVLSFLGVLALYGTQRTFAAGNWGWPLVVVLCALFFAIGNVYTRHFFRNDVHPIVLAFMQLGSALIVLTPFVLLTKGSHVEPSSVVSMLAVLELGVFSSGFAYAILSFLIRAWGSTAASMNTYLQPMVGLLLGVLVLGDVMMTSGWISLVLIFAGVLLFGISSVRDSARRRKEPPLTVGY